MTKGGATWRIAGREVTVTHLEERYWPEDGITKADLLAYYRDLAPVMLPYFAERPVTLRVCPDGIGGQCFYRRDLPGGAPPWLRSAAYVPESTDREIRLPLVDDAAGLVWLANTGSIEFHLWTARLPDLSTPDQVVFDLDPGDRATFENVLGVALLLRESLLAMGLRGYAKTTGGRGVHVYVPIAPGPPFGEVRDWVKRLAERFAAEHPDLVAVARGATHQGSRVSVDYAQNSVGRNTAAAYTVRALPGAPVSTPLTWDEVAAGRVRPAGLTLRTVPERVRASGDPFAPVLDGNQRLPRL